MKGSTSGLLACLLASCLGSQNGLYELSPAAQVEFDRERKATLANEWAAAKRLAKKVKAPILVFVLPPADAEPDQEQVLRLCKIERRTEMLPYCPDRAQSVETARDLLLRSVQLLRGAGHEGGEGFEEITPAQTVLALTIPVFVRPGDCGAKEGENVILLRCDGKREAAWQLDLLDRERFARTLLPRVGTEQQLAARRANAPKHVLEYVALVHKGIRHETKAEYDRRCELIEEWMYKEREYLPLIAPALLGSASKGDAKTFLCEYEQGRPPLGCGQWHPHMMSLLGRGASNIPRHRDTELRLVPEKIERRLQDRNR